MMHRCSSNMVGQCTCGLFHGQSNSVTMLFSMPNEKSYDETDMNPYASSSSSSVDCTLSLGTPSTRLCEDDEKRSICHERRMSNFCWDLLQTKNSPYSPQTHKSTSRGTNSSTNNNNSNNNNNNNQLLARRCANCDTTSTPLWRNGPRGPKSLCNACGIRFKKEERRATAANASSNINGSGSSGTMDHHQHYAYQSNSWVQTQKMQCFSPANEFRFIEDSDSFLSWRLNVTDRPSLVHDFTR